MEELKKNLQEVVLACFTGFIGQDLRVAHYYSSYCREAMGERLESSIKKQYPTLNKWILMFLRAEFVL